ncbi:hypothetical protein [Micromonospora sp. LH3U1]|uniref:hypothetical protein n=1 Tax=Micromonospora sp. LH3U1 TaxID=3018339 RepID=UPI00234A3F64|nr:hypothetical protein [Micromonospora sp. LH3U1]WCN80139.1 hypothetical protein PCA76_24775 [Micromonospora sp. LH3U1]
MISDTFVTRGGLTYVDRRDFTRGDTLSAVRRLAWPTVKLHADDSTLTFSSRTGSDTLQHAQVTALPHRPFHGRFPLPASAVSLEVEGRDQVLLFWTPCVGAVLRELAELGWDAEDPGH